MVFDDGSSLLSNEIIFKSPINLSKLQVMLLDPWGSVIDIGNLNFSFTLEVTEIVNKQLHETYRNHRN